MLTTKMSLRIRVIKQDGSREPFNEDKLLNGLHRALEKRPVSTEQALGISFFKK